MAFSSEKLPILLIEDRKEQAEQISTRLADQYNVVHLLSYDVAKLDNYKAFYPDSQIFIVDLVLNTNDDINEGINTIRNKLWKIDRTTFFIIFSGFINEENLPSWNEVEPHWSFVKKEFVNGELSDACLDNLYNMVGKCRRYTSPVLVTPWEDAFYYTDVIDAYAANAKSIRDNHQKVIRDNIINSINLLNELSAACVYYAKAGEEAAQLGIVIYGSCGRLEMRSDSDIECSIYYDGEGSDDLGELAVAFWNRITRYIEDVKELVYEGADVIDESTNRLLMPNQADEPLKNKFYPVIDRRILFEADLGKEPHVRDRHFQILTEMRSIFNPAFLFSLRREIFFRHVENTISLPTIVRSSYFRKTVAQFELDTAPTKISAWGDIKRFCYRVLNIWALRLALIGRLASNKSESLKSDEDWAEFFEVLSAPGVFKVIAFALEMSGLIKDENDRKGISEKLEQFISGYFATSVRFSDGGDSADDLRVMIKKTSEHFYEVLRELSNLKYLKTVKDENPWLFSYDEIQQKLNDWT